MSKEINLEKELTKYFFKSDLKVQFHQVDAIGILYNVDYFIIFENARLDYLQNLGLIKKLSDIVRTFPVLTAGHKIDYLNFAEFNDYVEIYTRVSKIGNSSIIFENIAVKNSQTVIAKASTAYVFINPSTKTSTPIPEDLKQKFIDFERGNIQLNSSINEKN